MLWQMGRLQQLSLHGRVPGCLAPLSTLSGMLMPPITYTQCLTVSCLHNPCAIVLSMFLSIYCTLLLQRAHPSSAWPGALRAPVCASA